jgi:hydrocephalus-inducing protein
VRVEAPDSALFSVSRQGLAPGVRALDGAAKGGADEGSKVAPGMEVVYTVKFRPDSPGDAAAALVVATERERFLVPLVGAGAAAALDLPDAIELREAPPVRATARHSLLVSNVGAAPGSFTLRAGAPFSVVPAAARLAPGESLQVVVGFAPQGAGLWEGELKVAYEGSARVTYTRLLGRGRELDVALSLGVLEFLPTYRGRLNQLSVWVVNDSDWPAAFAFKQRPVDSRGGGDVVGGGVADLGSCVAARQDGEAAVYGEAGCGDDVPGARDDKTRRSDGCQANGGSGKDEVTAVAVEVLRPFEPSGASSASHAASGDGSSLLSDASLAAARRSKQACCDAAADSQLFCSAYFCVFPPRGVVAPRGRMEVVLQFAPDHAREFTATAYVELEGRTERVPLALRGRGLGAVAAFPYESLDVGDAFVNTPHAYEVELMNRGKVDAEFSMQPCHTRCVEGSREG